MKIQELLLIIIIIASIVGLIASSILLFRCDKSCAMNCGNGWYRYQNFEPKLNNGTVKYYLVQ